MAVAICPECGHEIDFSEFDVRFEGELLPCPGCGVGLEVVSLDPPEVGLEPKEEDDFGE